MALGLSCDDPGDLRADRLPAREPGGGKGDDHEQRPSDRARHHELDAQGSDRLLRDEDERALPQHAEEEDQALPSPPREPRRA